MTPPDTLSLPASAEACPASSERLSANLPQHLMSRLLRDAKRAGLQRGEVLFGRGEPSETCFLVRRGIVKVSIDAPTGEQRIVGLHGPDDMVGELSMIDGGPRQTTAEAMTDCELLVVQRCAFVADLKAHPDVYPDIVAMLARRIRNVTEEITRAAFLPMKARVACALLRLAQLLGERMGVDRLGIEQQINQADIADMAGVSRESVSRTMAEWKNAGDRVPWPLPPGAQRAPAR